MQKYQSNINAESGLIAPILAGGGYGGTLDMAGLQSVAIAVNAANQQIYGDGVQLDEINIVVNNTVTLTTAGETDRLLAVVQGQTFADGEVVLHESDEPPFMGLCYLEQVRGANATNNTTMTGYRGVFYPRGKFAPPGKTTTSRTDNISPSTTQLVYTALATDKGTLGASKLFTGATAKTEALAWCREKLAPATPNQSTEEDDNE